MSTWKTSISQAEYRALLAAPGSPSVHKVKRGTPEEDLHRDVMAWVNLHLVRYPVLEWLIHPPNGGKRPKGEAGKLKAMGVKPGVPDLILPLSCGQWKGLAIELKSPTNKTSAAQAAWLARLEADGWLVGVVRTLDGAIEIIKQFLDGRQP